MLGHTAADHHTLHTSQLQHCTHTGISALESLSVESLQCAGSALEGTCLPNVGKTV